MKTKKLVFLEICALVFSLCGCEKSLGKVTAEDLTVDVRDDLSSLEILELEEGTEASYELDEENGKLIITLVNGEDTQVIEKEVTVQYPLGTLKQEIIDYYTYKDFNPLDYIDLAEGVECSYDINVDSSRIDYTLKTEDREEKLSAELNVIRTLNEHSLTSVKMCNEIDEVSIIRLDGNDYYIFDLYDDGTAQLLSVEKLFQMSYSDAIPEEALVNPFQSAATLDSLGDYNHNGIVDTYDGISNNVYEGSKVDKYLENDFYNSLSEETRNAIVERELNVTSYDIGFQYMSTIRRKVYLLDATDYSAMSVSKVFRIFKDTSFSTRTTCGYNRTAFYFVWSYDCNPNYDGICFANLEHSHNPSFTVDLNKLPDTSLVR